MRIPRLLSLVAAVALTAAAPDATSAQMESMSRGEMKKSSTSGMMRMEKMMAGWPKASKEAAMFMTKKYGAPKHMNEHMAMWGRTGPWKRTVVYNYEVSHQFPGPHTDVMQQWVDYKAAPESFGKVAMYDGSVVVERTNGEISARCDLEAANFLALNLADEIIGGKRGVDDARRMYGEQIMAMKAGRPTAYTQRLLFTPAMGGTADPDHPGMSRMSGMRAP